MNNFMIELTNTQIPNIQARNFMYAFGVGAESILTALRKMPERTENDIENLRNQRREQQSQQEQNNDNKQH